MRRDDILALKEQRHVLITDMQKMFTDAEARSDNPGFTAEEAEKYDQMEAEFRSLTERWQKAEDLFAKEQEVRHALNTPVELRVSGGDDVPSSLAEWRVKMGHTKLHDTAEYRSAWFSYMTKPNLAELDVEEIRTLSKATAAAGANLVPTAFYDQIINILRFTGPINELATEIRTDSGETMQVPAVTAHGVATWTAENAAYTASDETFGQASLGAFKIGRTVNVSDELLTDSAFPLEGYLAQELGESIGVAEETAFAVGDGTGKPLGIATTGNGLTVSTAAVGNAATLTYPAMVSWQFALPYQYRRNAVWIIADTAVRNLYTMTDSQNRPLWNINVATTGPDTFLGKPIYTSPDLAAVGANAKFGVFGDIRQAYMIRRVNGFELKRLNEIAALNGQVVFRGTERVDGRIRNAQAAIVLQNSAT
jgi:HK97 family phage major capsid protein